MESHRGLWTMGYKMPLSQGLFSIFRLTRAADKILKGYNVPRDLLQLPVCHDPRPTEALSLLTMYCYGSWFAGKVSNIAAAALIHVNVKTWIGPHLDSTCTRRPSRAKANQ